jgi:RNA polymerase sigma-70 factor (ECF subfamily)
VTPSLADEVRFRQLYDGNLDLLRRYCFRRLPFDEVDDAVAEVFVVAWRRMDDVPDGDEALLWLYGVARNIVRNLRRTTRPRYRLASKMRRTGTPVAPDPGAEVVRRADYQETLDCLATLREGDQEVLRLAAWEELKPAEIGQVIGVAPHAASARLGRARDRLAKAMHMERAGVGGWLAPQPYSEGGEW